MNSDRLTGKVDCNRLQDPVGLLKEDYKLTRETQESFSALMGTFLGYFSNHTWGQISL